MRRFLRSTSSDGQAPSCAVCGSSSSIGSRSESLTDSLISLVDGEFRMMMSISERASMFVEQVIHLARAEGFDTLPRDDMVVLAEGFLEKQREFKRLGKPTLVEVGYHNTKPEHMPGIQRHGLMPSVGVGSTFGDGVYTANNPDAFRCFGSRGLMCVILKGKAQRIVGDRGDLDTGVGNYRGKLEWNEHNVGLDPLYFDEYVLGTGAQCLPLISYDVPSTRSMIPFRSTRIWRERLWRCHMELQLWLDVFFNSGVVTVPKRITFNKQITPSPSKLALVALRITRERQLLPAEPSASAPESITQGGQTAPLHIAPQTATLPWLPPSAYDSNNWRELTEHIVRIAYVAPRRPSIPNPWMQREDIEQSACGPCFEGYTNQQDAVKFDKCHHNFHPACSEIALSHEDRCPLCSEELAKNQGKSPSGTMTISWSSLVCDGCESSVGSFVIEYSVLGGIQEAYHDHPGFPYAPTWQKAFVPYTNEAWDVLKRLAWAFQHGLTFTVGSEFTTGHGSSITWSSIPHKTQRCQGPYQRCQAGPQGFPDEEYFTKLNNELDALEVPGANQLPEVSALTDES